MIQAINFEDGDTAAEWHIKIEDTKPGQINTDLCQSFYKWLENLLTNPEKRNSLFGIVTEQLPADRQISICIDEVKGPVNHSTAGAVSTLHQNKNAPTKEVEELLPRLIPSKHHPYIAWQICRFLLSRGIKKEDCIKTLEKFSKQRVVEGYRGNPYDYELALLCLSYSPVKVLELLRTALRSKTPAAVESTAALMALIDEPWSRAEVINAITDGSLIDDTTAQRNLASALVHSSDSQTQ